MISLLGRNWWMVVLRGVLAVLFGLLAFIWPEITVQVLVILFGAYLLVDGVFAIAAAVRHRRRYGGSTPLILEGVLSLAIGGVSLVWPQITAIALLYLIAAWAIASGVLEIIAALLLRGALAGGWLLGLVGVLSIVVGGVLIASPEPGLLALVWLIAGFALVFGIVLITLGLLLRRWHRTISQERVRP